MPRQSGPTQKSRKAAFLLPNGVAKNMSGPSALKRPWGSASANAAPKRQPMLDAILAYHVEEDVASWTPQEDAALMLDLNKVHDRLTQEDRMGPAARLGATTKACVLRGEGKGVVIDG